MPEMMSGKVRIAVGGSPNFHGLSVILFELKEAFAGNFTFYETMDEVVEHALKITQQ